MIICGDMNIKLGVNDSFTSFQQTRAGKALQELLQEFELVDVWRELFPNIKRYTWRRTRPLQQSRLDYIFISDNLHRCRLTKARIDPGFLSDHSFVYAEIDARNPSRGPGIWRFNNELLDDTVFRVTIKDELQKFIERNEPYDGESSKGLLIDLLLSNCRSKCITRSKEIKAEQRREEKELAEEVKILEQRLERNVPETIQEYERARARLEEIKLKRGQLAILSSGARWIEHGEKPSKYFLNLSKKRAAQKSIIALKTSDGNVIEESKAILEYCAEYFEDLYKTRNVERDKMSAFYLHDNDLKLTDQEKAVCDGPITKDECLTALKGMAKDKAPGITGFTAEFYASFWDELGDIIVEYINEAYEKEQFFINHVRGIGETRLRRPP